VVEAVLNHRSGVIKGVAATYNVYAYAAEKRAALAAWGSHVESIVAAPVADVVERPASLREFESGAL
jgi:hypothetical protein